ncbi:hypothetical protein MAR_007155 [Mya arenaria]|uniref:Uncharacterized protein n=1 Tax=Mya arenaria TaxID=6604 RepID=A0ABY7DE43_MYAAR|nr:hypothetical protein MAR_007155 [Mya arenaria]
MLMVARWRRRGFGQRGSAGALVAGRAAWALGTGGEALLSTLVVPLSGTGRDVEPGCGFHFAQNMAYLEAVCEGDQDGPVDDLTTNEATSTYSHRVTYGE